MGVMDRRAEATHSDCVCPWCGMMYDHEDFLRLFRRGDLSEMQAWMRAQESRHVNHATVDDFGKVRS
jgi:hypothetical protein